MQHHPTLQVAFNNNNLLLLVLLQMILQKLLLLGIALLDLQQLSYLLIGLLLLWLLLLLLRHCLFYLQVLPHHALVEVRVELGNIVLPVRPVDHIVAIALAVPHARLIAFPGVTLSRTGADALANEHRTLRTRHAGSVEVVRTGLRKPLRAQIHAVRQAFFVKVFISYNEGGADYLVYYYGAAA